MSSNHYFTAHQLDKKSSELQVGFRRCELLYHLHKLVVLMQLDPGFVRSCRELCSHTLLACLTRDCC